MAIDILYETAFEEKRLNLIQTAKSQARLIEAIASYDRQFFKFKHQNGEFAATLEQITEAHRNYDGMGKTGEFTLAKLNDGQIIFLLRQRHSDQIIPNPVSLKSNLAEPMRNALKGNSGSLIGLDYRGEMVLAAHEPVAVLDLGIVAKVDLSEIRLPFIRAGGGVLALSIILISIGTALFFKITNPMINKLNKNEERFKEIAHMASDGFWEMDNNFRFTSFTELKGGFQVEPEHHIGKTRWESAGVYPDEDDKWGNHRDDHLAHRPYSNFEYSIVKDGKTLYLSSSSAPPFDEAGNFTGY